MSTHLPGGTARSQVSTLLFVVSVVLTVSGTVSSPGQATPLARLGEPERLLLDRAPRPGEIALPTLSGGERPDTINFGFYEVRPDGKKYAVRDGVWSWDHGAPDPLEGWTSIDLTENLADYWRWMTEAIWQGEGNPGPWPQMNAGSGFVLCGASEPQADTLGWTEGIGYGNNWCQRLTSPPLTYGGAGTVDLSFHYFNQTEEGYDYSKVILLVGSNQALLNSPGFTGPIGIDTLGVITQAEYARSITNSELGGGSSPREFAVRIEVRSDGGLSDEDGSSGWDAVYGALGVDDVVLQGDLAGGDVAFDFESGLQGWTASRCPGVGSLMGVNPVTSYVIQDPCTCAISGQVLELHDALYQHPGDNDPTPQHEIAYSCIVDRKTDLGDPLYLDYNRILATWDHYCELPQENGVFYRPGWSYYPYENPNLPGLVTWSPRVGQGTYFYVGTDPSCFRETNIGTDWGLPPDCEQVRFLYELNSTCDGFGIPEDQCTDLTNFTPILDNVVVRTTRVPNAPRITLLTGCAFQDGFGTGEWGFSPTEPGNADIVYDTRLGQESAPTRLGDSLVVTGPVPNSSTRWEAKLWLRLPRVSPYQQTNSTYTTWKTAFIAAKGIDFAPPASQFTWGYMDSVETVTQISKSKFCSQFRDGPSSGGHDLPPDPMYRWGGGTGEQDEGNEIIPDGALLPGTKVEYFITSNYTCSPMEYFYLPDTTGGNFLELEILPSVRLEGSVTKYPCILYVDAYNRGTQADVENALNVILNRAEPGDPVPSPTLWDRYDYLDASSNWKGPFYREYGGNSGANMYQLACYRAILFDTGTFDTGTTWTRDWQGVEQWLTFYGGNSLPQSFLGAGTSISKIINQLYPVLLSAKLGAVHRCDTYSEEQCPPGEADNDQQYCVRLDRVAGTPFRDGIPTDVYGNWCPSSLHFGVMGSTGTGVGHQTYTKVNGGPTHYSQIINDRSGTTDRYRSVLSDWSFLHLTARDLGVAPDPDTECPSDDASRNAALVAELRGQLNWSLGYYDVSYLGLCPTNTNDVPPDVPGNAFVNRLYPNHPNPFNPRTVIRFSLAIAGQAHLVIFDAAGRRVRTLVDGPLAAGVHESIWDGLDDSGRQVTSGVYWSQLRSMEFTSHRKLVLLK